MKPLPGLKSAAPDKASGLPSVEAGPPREAIEAVLGDYEAALNAADIDGVVSVFAGDGVFMPQYGVAAIGPEAIRAAYQSIFSMMAFETELRVEEIVSVAPDWAFARTTSSGFVTFQANGQRYPDANHELFIFQRSADGAWKIARYCFSTTNPPRQ